MSQPSRDSQPTSSPSTANKPVPGDATEFASEAELRDAAGHEPLGGADVEHCQRMRG
jgi:hypothetical protein